MQWLALLNFIIVPSLFPHHCIELFCRNVIFVRLIRRKTFEQLKTTFDKASAFLLNIIVFYFCNIIYSVRVIHTTKLSSFPRQYYSNTYVYLESYQ